MAYLSSSTPQNGHRTQAMCATCQHNGAETIQRHLTYSRAVPADYIEISSGDYEESGNKAGKQATATTCTKQPMKSKAVRPRYRSQATRPALSLLHWITTCLVQAEQTARYNLPISWIGPIQDLQLTSTSGIS
ncbi:Hypothetical predicted protein [Pelobates cultripes]|uniref:Uncharacterized protein n=1 Tax=Pelobates cultripes TaxID=61616 RepID=A0AAD1WYH8_PELCU|nr:Hypothetical predicted protein [Pelobates cultripes]